MQTQKTLVEMHPDKGILNIDVLSFERLAYRVLEEVGGDTRSLLEETGKNMVLQKLVQNHQKELVYLKNQIKKPGCLDEVKSLISEFMQYEVGEEELQKMQEGVGKSKLLQMKLQDVTVLYKAFRAYLKDHYMTSEEVLEVLARELVFSRKLRDSVFLMDGFTGFTPVQIKVIRELLTVCSRVSVTVTMDVREPFLCKEKSHQLFYMSHKMIRSLTELTKDMEEPVWIKPGKASRFAKAPALSFLEQNLFRYNRKEYKEKSAEDVYKRQGYTLTEGEIIRLFYFKFSEIPLLSRMEAVGEYFIDQVETLRGRDLSEEEREEITDKFFSMYGTRDFYVLYSRFLEREAYRPLPKKPLEKRRLKYEDVYPLLYLKHNLIRCREHREIRHLVVDEMQDYSCCLLYTSRCV